MSRMNGNGTRLLGYLVWQGGKWYLRRRMPSPRRVVATALVAATAVAIGVVVVRRAAG